MSITLKKLAEELRLSPATVSMALRNSPVIAAKTRESVNRYAAERGYVRNDVGAALKLRRTRLIGFFMQGVVRSFYHEVLQGAADAAAGLGYGLLLELFSPSGDSSAQVRLMLEKNVDALVIAGKPGEAETLIPRFLNRGIPVIFCTGTAMPGCSSVHNDDFLGGRLAVELLAEQGHRVLAVSTQWPERYAGNCAAAAECGVILHPYQLAEEAVALVRQHREITGITAYSDDEAIKLLHLFRPLGIRVPADVSLVGFDDLPAAALPEFSLSTIAQQRTRLGAEAVRLAVRQAQLENPAPEEIILDPQAVRRNSVRETRN